ncbi:hypothetical protein LEMLEM_LOCUS12709, partial [Lemmus lemmus]
EISRWEDQRLLLRTELLQSPCGCLKASDRRLQACAWKLLDTEEWQRFKRQSWGAKGLTFRGSLILNS